MARYDFMEDSQEENTVSKIAYKWGFTHGTIFCLLHRAIWGESITNTQKILL